MKINSHAYYRKHSLKFLILLGCGLLISTCCLFIPESSGMVSIIGSVVLSLTLPMLIINMLGFHIFCPIHPDDVLRDLNKNRYLRGRIEDLNTARNELVVGRSTPDHIHKTMEEKVLCLLDECGDEFRKSFLMHIFRYLGFLVCMFVLFADASRMLVLNGSMHYKNLDFTSNIIDHLYYSLVTLVTIGYGDIYPVSAFARGVCIVEGVMVLFSMIILVNYIFVYESKREERVYNCLIRNLK
jgi:hypothetical protein